MKPLGIFTLLGLVALSALAPAAEQPSVRCLTEPEVQRVFSGPARTVNVRWRNAGDDEFTADLRLRLLQASSATTVRLSESPWRILRLLPGQTVLESATVDFPPVNSETRFLLQWIAGTNQSFGTTEVLAYPTNLLGELKTLAGAEQAVGLFDPDNRLKPLLLANGVEFEDMQDSGVADFRGKLAILGPFAEPGQMPGDLGERIEKLARKGTGVVWLQPPPGPRAKLQPSFRTVPIGEGAVVVAQPSLVTNLANHPQSQLNLLQLCRLAREPVPPRLSNLQSEP